MNILFLDAYFEPEQISFTHLEKDLLNGLVNQGHRVEVICPTPTRGIDRKTANTYKKRLFETRYDGYVHITRFNSPHEGKNPIIRAFRYFWCNIRTYQIGRKTRNIDIVFAGSTPPTQGFVASRVAKKLGVPFIYSLQDIFPDSLVNAGMTKKGSLLYKIGRRIEDYTYKNADKIIVISESFKQNIMAKGVPEEKIVVVPNWVDTESIKPVKRGDNKLFDEFGIDRDKFIVLYAGNFGASQGTDVILDAAKLLKSEKNIQFVLFGGGSEFGKTKNKIIENDLSNVTINPLLPPERVSEVYSMGDVALITCKKGVGNAGMPSKTWSIMACDTPIIASFDTDSELSRILKSSNTGICTEPENPEDLADSILEVKNGNFGFLSGRNYVFSNANKDTCLEKYTKTIRSLI